MPFLSFLRLISLHFHRSRRDMIWGEEEGPYEVEGGQEWLIMGGHDGYSFIHV
jgi:hypothetical protein